jgi:hypothetical protein
LIVVVCSITCAPASRGSGQLEKDAAHDQDDVGLRGGGSDPARSGGSGGQSAKRRLASTISPPSEVSDPQISADGAWVAPVVRTTDVENDRMSSDVWMSSGTGTQRVSSPHGESERQPCWSPDGHLLAFLAARHGGEDPGLGGDGPGGWRGAQLTRLPGGVSDFVCRPTASGWRVAAKSGAEAVTSGREADAAPIVIDRYQFKQDVKATWSASTAISACSTWRARRPTS